jgi:hypothetical protein
VRGVTFLLWAAACIAYSPTMSSSLCASAPLPAMLVSELMFATLSPAMMPSSTPVTGDVSAYSVWPK